MATVLTQSDPAIAVPAGNTGSYVDWGAIFAGAVVAAAISSIFLTFGSAIGLSLTSFTEGSALSTTGLAIAAGLWLLWVQVSSFLGGGYVAGRLRRKALDATPHEVEMRDGSHGLIAWAAAVVLGAFVAGWIAMAGASGIANVAGTVAGAVGSYHIDRLFRPAPAAEGAAAAPAAAPAVDMTQISRIFARSTGGTMEAADTDYVSQQIAARTGIPVAEAQTRLTQTLALIKAEADKARRAGIILAFISAVSLIVGAVAAWWAATLGGAHRDQGIDHSRFSRWR